MSTHGRIVLLEGRANLCRFLPVFRGREQELRRLSLTPTVHDWAYSLVKTMGQREMRSNVRAHFGQFVKGEKVNDLTFMKRVEFRGNGWPDLSHDVWSITPRFYPQHRFFGAFATPDWFIATNVQSRDHLNEHDKRWDREITKAIDIWDELFPGQRRFSGTEFSHYVTFNAEHHDGRW